MANPLVQSWLAIWPEALACWSALAQLQPPRFFTNLAEARSEGLDQALAGVRLRDQAIFINLPFIHDRRLDEFALPILAHEIGHHVLAPTTLSENGRLLAAVQSVLVHLSSGSDRLTANLYADLLVNDRLHRQAGLDMVPFFTRLVAETDWGVASQTWRLTLRTYEILWRLASGILTGGSVPTEMNADALLLARLVRHYSGNWLAGARRFALVLFSYLHEDQQNERQDTFTTLGLADLRHAGQGGWPEGLTLIEASEFDDPSFDRELAGLDEEQPLEVEREREALNPANTMPLSEGIHTSPGQAREPFAYGELLRSLGLDLSQHEITTRYYRERALPHLIAFPDRRIPRSLEPMAEGYEHWDADEDLEHLDLFGSILRSPVLIPGVTTVQRTYGLVPGTDPGRVPLDLDIYVDCSGSMPNPAINVSYLALAGTILALSALRRGARVQATLWSGPGQFETSGGFSRDERQILGIITGYISGSTAFPLHVLRDTYRTRREDDPPAHIVVISDDGVDTLLQRDVKKQPGAEICRKALQAARGGGTLVLNLPRVEGWKPSEVLTELGFVIHAVQDWPQLVDFARAFVRENYRD